MSDKISIIYDANVDALNNKLNEIIQKNILVKGSVDEATKSLKNMADALQKQHFASFSTSTIAKHSHQLLSPVAQYSFSKHPSIHAIS